MRKTVSERLSHSYHTAVHGTLTTEIDASEIVKFRQNILPEIKKTANVHLTFTDILIKGFGKVLREHIILNSTLRMKTS